ncbi:transglycosylase SLT domain-containing protein [Thalassotalea castellviae]|uniref:Transglycosylase SLT domain-containing protein n=1 Tax=Thalassotalea castellviae TaxID=3075612 RepID=A0ABU3A246_9GAMM|nr:transglycosylase SLT domain-containing protein [Thalassotalea sp. W431]MDT0604254.1 transglycosylase SLT domain-containing protein [Thalassotalea sp. W431]
MRTFLLVFALFFSIVFTSNASEGYLLRKTFENAEKQLWKSNSSTYQELYQQLNYYPLQPYLDQKRLIHRMRLSSAKEIASFLDKYQGSPLDWPLRKKWLNYLIKRNRQALFIEFFQPTYDVNLTCHYYQYQLNKGVAESNVLPKIAKLWVVGKSQPKSCDPLFERWQKAGLRTPEHVWQRLGLAADGGKHTLIPYLTGLLPENEQYLGKLWHKVRRDPAYITKLSRFPNKNDKETTIYTYGIKRLIWRDQNRALKSYQQAKTNFAFTEEQQQKIALKFSLALASKNHPSANEWLKQVDDNNLTDNIVQWKIADVLRKQNWPTIKTELLSLPDAYQQKQQWKYWYARSLLATNEQVLGKQLMEELADTRHYYGFLAATYSDKPVNLQNKPLQISEQEKIELFKNAAGKRAFEFFHLGRYYHARLEWNYWLRQLTERQKLVAAKLANEIGWYDRAIFALSQVGYLDDVDLRFPLAFNDEIKQHASKYAINPAWAFAITRRESSFMSDANSSVGARGLMQLMPDTAKHLTRRKKVSTKYLLDSKNNINLGTKYLKDLLDRHKGNQVLATAAYNAGPYRVKKWLKSANELPADIWIETIPFRETREYVKSVLAYQEIYQHKVGEQSSLFDQLHSLNITQL